ncbi:hypothetical protein J7E50_25875 [Pedobacter sp. ISL-68]|uniref:hypothetical protein n=1 Tax=unclassified Pedobacter TaxID=2628915 RepID=UPI001BE5F0F9|nr:MULTISPECIES: hypothetical protein [unclassified Pedobacter]MBT2564808.1 hypothetical protein [Pedobacter sp. ISL-64]MBT2593670.1 hypothetical protein [Pedobacter sp. ISL-68]
MTNVMFKKPRFVIPEAAKNKPIADIVMFVAGTTDPVNTAGLKHQANTEYWRGIDAKTHKATAESVSNFWNKIKEIKFQYLNLHIEGDFFSWSGDNDTKERNIAAERLMDVMLRTYRNWRHQEVHLHLIGHSHGGNVINQFTELITSKEMIAKSEVLKRNKFTEFPKLWKIKSITYLSTPFFQKKHQLNHTKLHSACKIINVHNEYDLTQQLVADFSLVNMEGLLKSFQMDKFERGIKTVKSVKHEVITDYLKGWRSEKKAIAAWKEMATAFLGINMIISEFIKYINSLKIENSSLQKEKDSFVSILNKFLLWSYDVNKNYNGGKKGYDKVTWATNLNLSQGLTVLNTLFHIKSGPKDSYLLSLLANIFGEKRGITDSIDETSWTPKKQTKGLSILDVPIFDKDPYNSRNKRAQFGTFLKGAQNAVHSNNLEDMLMRLFSQFIKPAQLANIYNYINYAEYVVTGNLDAQLKILGGNLKKYTEFVTKYNADLVAEKDENIAELDKKPGSIPYLAMTSHSLSHTRFWPKIEEGLRGAFSSGVNTGYKKK